MRSPNRLIAYEHTHNYCYHLDREGISVPRSGLELSNGPGLYRKRSFLDAFSCPVARLRAAGWKCDSSIVLVLEHRRKRPHVSLFYFPTRPGWHPGLSPELDDLHSQFDAYPEAQVRFHRCRALPKTARRGVLSTLWAQVGLTVERSDATRWSATSGHVGGSYGFLDSPAGKFAAFQSIAIRIRARPLG